MKLSTVKRYRKKHRLLGSLILKNPVLVMGLDLPFVIVASTSMRNAVALSMQLLLVHMVTVTVGMITCRKLPIWQRAMVNAGVSTVTMMLSRILVRAIFPGITNSAGMYLYLMAVNGMTLLQTGEQDKQAKPWTVLTGALYNVLGFGSVVALVSVLREYVGNGTLWGVNLPSIIKVGGVLLPFGGFIVMALVLAAAKFLSKKFLGLALVESARKEAQYTQIKVISQEIL